MPGVCKYAPCKDCRGGAHLRGALSPTKTKAQKLPSPKTPAERTRAVQQALSAAAAPLAAKTLAAQFQRAQAGQVEKILDALCSLGLARRVRGKYTA
jgi:hypothetical protein